MELDVIRKKAVSLACRSAKRVLDTLDVLASVPTPKVAVFYDAENVSFKSYEVVAELAKATGHVVAMRVYGPVGLLAHQPWQNIAKNQSADMIVCNGSVSGKNSVDIRIAMDVMEFLATENCTDYFIVSNDSDYASLARRIRLKGCVAHGAGVKGHVNKCAAAFDTWTYLPLGKLTHDLQDSLTHAVERTKRKDGWSKLSSVGMFLKNNCNVNHADYGYKTLTDLIKDADVLELRNDGSGHTEVRLKPGARVNGQVRSA